MALNIKITNQETVNPAVVKLCAPGGIVKVDDIIEPKNQKEYILYGNDYIKISQD